MLYPTASGNLHQIKMALVNKKMHVAMEKL